MKNALVVGAVSIDKYVLVESFPGEDAMVFATETFNKVGGSGANIAQNIAVNGGNVTFCTGIGTDARGEYLTTNLSENGVKTIVDKAEGDSAETLILVNKDGARKIISFGGNALFYGEAPLVEDVDVLCLVDVDPEIALQFINIYPNVKTIYVPGGCGLWFGADAIKSVAKKCDITIVSDVEKGEIGEDFYKLSPITIVTNGSLPTEIFSADTKQEIAVNLIEKEMVIDTTGAGDAFASGMILSSDKSIEDAINHGHALASKVITKFGANLVHGTDGEK